ncbi:Methionine--tRNA ligase [Dissostichus eleginoides]|uniref:Methionine--tRNA ligase n=1 Tax=Dissostichus eleginoides TaxID=100907 RepID=A0AAD9B043_DISEL|nr:Methionine--tRNA ligase [Dissostichus eleginoides]
MDLLSEQQLGSPSHIIIHTGSNDLRSQQESVRVTQRSDRESLHHLPQQQSGHVNPATKTSTPTHPQDQQQHVQRLYPEAQRPPGPSPTLDINCLYDHVHLYKNTVPIFARTLKDVALNRDQSTPRRRSSRPKTPLDQKGTPLDHHPDNTHGDKIILIFFHTMPPKIPPGQL